MRRRDFIACAAGALALPRIAFAQGQRKPRIGWLVFGSNKDGPIDKPVLTELAARGFVDGQNVEIDFRFANGQQTRVDALAEELLARKPDVLFGLGSEVVKSMFDRTRQIPVVGGVSENPIRAGFTNSLARPSFNFTGTTFLTDEMAAKRIELLKEVFPAAKRVGMLWNPQHLDDEVTFARRAAQSLNLELMSFEVADAEGLFKAMPEAVAKGVDSLFVIPSRLTSVNAARIGAFGRDNKLPVVTAWREFTAVDCLLSYGPNRQHQGKVLADYIVRVLRGAVPADLPIQQPTSFELVVNLRTAKAIGLKIPDSTMLRADDVIE